MNTEQDLSGEDVEETLHHNENYDSGTERRCVLCRGLIPPTNVLCL